MPSRVLEVRFKMECVRDGVSSTCPGESRGEGGDCGVLVS